MDQGKVGGILMCTTDPITAVNWQEVAATTCCTSFVTDLEPYRPYWFAVRDWLRR